MPWHSPAPKRRKTRPEGGTGAVECAIDAPGDVTALLVAWGDGDPAALDRLMPLVYDELRRVARRHMAGERHDDTLQATALVNETYMKLVDLHRIRWQNRAHFFALSATLMRRILVDAARARQAKKRGDGAMPVSLADCATLTDSPTGDILAVDTALEQLAAIDPRKARVVELRFFAGLTVEEIAEALRLSRETVMRDWKMAKSWLALALRG